MINLFSHQDRAYNLVRESIMQGKNRPIIGAATSFGKTVLAAHMMKSCQDKGKRGWFFCDRIQLIRQTIETFRRFGIRFGVRQADHDLADSTAPIQIASIQTIQALVNSHNGRLPVFDFAMVDECHMQYEVINKILDQYDGVPIVGLSATPYAKGLGVRWNNLIVPITPRELLEQGYLCPVKYYGGEHIDLSKIRSADPNNYSTQDLERETERDQDRLTGCIIKNWLEWGENSQTIAFSPSQSHSKYLVERLNQAGITAFHIDCYNSEEERKDLFEAHNRGEFKVLSCSRLLNTGYDAPSVRCIIDCYPIKSITTYVQRLGRIMRTKEGKDYSIYLDHAGNFEKFGYAEDIVPTKLHNGETTHKESELVEPKDKKDAKTSECPQCYQQMAGMRCKSCGYQVPESEVMEDDGSMLVELGTQANKKDGQDLKYQFYAEMLGYAESKGRKPGWAAHQYKDKYGVFPGHNRPTAIEPGDLVKGWIKHQAIKRKASLKKGAEVVKNIKGFT